MSEKPEELFLDSHIITDPAWAALIFYCGVTIIRVVICSWMTYYEFGPIASHDWKLYEAEWANVEPITVECKKFSSALNQIHGFRVKAMKSNGEWRNEKAFEMF